ncbi:AraC family transcriptional regulator [Streptomyces spectabilis]|uniref:AraC family transcriptional regulator n=1 Tax=Streptomyces spectabilis TaxID=68270 RepID=A0A5P2XCY7_STRST|nr:AraC family transcriptional regulator [Streptomyces spectabilis]MBB5108650.1 AraC-like DNA-binding protein [Streptomyces spectabilis]MCI3904451.1 AraC family transcriptional regulator [Streptomyces spectabilis]QEV61544.1 AraC family transcriptional regulator [Streptomyces spectabilis]
MDALGDLLRGIRADGALFGRTVLRGAREPERTEAAAALTLVMVLRGQAHVTGPDGTRALRAGCAAVRTSGPFAVAAADGAETELVTGTYQWDGNGGRRLLSALPPLLVVPGGEECLTIIELIADEVAADRPGRQYVMDRMLDWLLACTLREWFDLPESCPPAWYRALGDDVVGPALRAMHEEPGRAWTVAALAARAQVSRAAFARNFTDLVGRPPMAYLTEWRMTLAAELLAEPGATVASVAGRVGYADGFGFSDAFKRIRGVTPSGHRASLVAGRAASGPSLRAAG